MDRARLAAERKLMAEDRSGRMEIESQLMLPIWDWYLAWRTGSVLGSRGITLMGNPEQYSVTKGKVEQ